MSDYGVAVISYTDEDTELTFLWHGGAYIDVCANGEAFDVINVWDDEADNSYLEHEPEGGWPAWQRPFRITLERFEARCQRWIAEDSELLDA